MTHGAGDRGVVLDDDTIASILRDGFVHGDLAGRNVLLIVPDGTRTAPMSRMFALIDAALRELGARCDVLIALGTHQPMDAGQIARLLGDGDPHWQSRYPDVSVDNHAWWDPASFSTLGHIPADDLAALSGGMLAHDVAVTINRRIHDYERILICGPVFPHEVVGFSGGNKYLFPGISGREVIDVSHWLGALITSYALIGTPGITPVRALIDRAAALVPTPRQCVALVVEPGSTALSGVYVGTPEQAWAAASALSQRMHVRTVPAPFRRVIAVMPPMYQDIWTAAKGMYKLEPIVADGGELVIYAPHITTFSVTHGPALAAIGGYHVRDYFVRQWERFRDHPWGVLAHSTHLRGVGSYDPATGEQPRVRVTLATGIDAARCAAHHVGYADPASIDPAALQGREAEGILVVPKAGEMLYRLAAQER